MYDSSKFMLGFPCPDFIKSHLWGFLLLLKTFTIGGSIIYFTFAKNLNEIEETVPEHHHLSLNQIATNDILGNNMPANDLMNGFADFVEASIET